MLGCLDYICDDTGIATILELVQSTAEFRILHFEGMIGIPSRRGADAVVIQNITRDPRSQELHWIGSNYRHSSSHQRSPRYKNLHRPPARFQPYNPQSTPPHVSQTLTGSARALAPGFAPEAFDSSTGQ